MNSPEIFDLKEAASYLRVSTLQLKALAKSGRITYTRVDRLHWRFARRDLDLFLERLTHQAKTAFSQP
jgi:excisionase family DNA binding protein